MKYWALLITTILCTSVFSMDRQGPHINNTSGCGRSVTSVLDRSSDSDRTTTQTVGGDSPTDAEWEAADILASLVGPGDGASDTDLYSDY